MPYKNTYYERAVESRFKVISNKVKRAIDFLEKQGFQEVPVPEKDKNKNKIMTQFFIVCDMSPNGIALVNYKPIGQVKRFELRYSLNGKVIPIMNKGLASMNVDTRTALFSFLLSIKPPINFVSPMWYKPYGLIDENFLSMLSPVKDEPTIPAARPVARPVAPVVPVPVAPTSDRVGGRTRHRKKQRFSSRNSMATKRNLVRKSRKGSGLFGKTPADNKRNCETYWHPTNKGHCTEKRIDEYDYPGLFHIGKKVKVKKEHFVGKKKMEIGTDVPEGEW